MHRYSKSMQMSKAQLALACKDLHIDKNDQTIYSFFLMFYNEEEDYYCTRRLSLLGILLGNSKLEEKVHLLFQNYDVDSSRTLGEDEIQLMLKDILTISFQNLPNFARHHISAEKCVQIDDYKKDLITMKGSFVKYYLGHFFEDTHDDMSYTKFCELFNKQDI